MNILRMHSDKRHVWVLGSFLLTVLISLGCNKLVKVSNPISSVTSEQVFSTDATATSAMMGIYSYMASNASFSSYQTTYYLGESADELTDEPAGFEMYDIFLSNSLSPLLASGYANPSFWQPAYYDIYNSNAIISGLQTGNGVTLKVRNELVGEAKFIRAFCYFYLSNTFGAVPLVSNIDFNQTALISKSSTDVVGQQMLSDLHDAVGLLSSDFSFSNGQPIRANKWSALALMARVYQYLGNWQGADSAASAVINSGQFRLVGSLDSVFLANSPESILELQSTNAPPYATLEGNFFIPFDSTSPANCWLTPQLMASFEQNDFRRSQWIDSTDYAGVVYYYPYKYRTRVGASGNGILENYAVLRLAEQYLIRAEAEYNLGQVTSAITDLDVIRSRAGLDSLSTSLSGSQLFEAIKQEYRVEFFAEWGHRWMDLRRWGISIQTLDTLPYKAGNINSTQLLYPIPITEIQTDPNVTQNPGYH